MEVISIPQERIFEDNVFPISFGATADSETLADLTKWIEANRSSLDDYLRRHKAILFRCGQAATSAQDFHAIVEATGLAGMPYIGGAAVRTQLTDRVFTANESPSTENIPFHHELAQTPEPPTHLFFYCNVAPSVGGETPILVSTEVYDRMHILHPQFMDKIEKHGICYVRYMPEHDDPTSAIGRGWRSTFQANTRGSYF
mmetsp:Transcript_641/g.1137  ORF Transcript_641/g.1137 Transcript_641/m.1137 type:complete len:200 (-) Transcript_641:672-1271(-)